MVVVVFGGTLLGGVVGIVTPTVRTAVGVGGIESPDVGELVGEATFRLLFASLSEYVSLPGVSNVLAAFESLERALYDLRWSVEKAPEIGGCDRLLDTLADHPVGRFEDLVAPEQLVDILASGARLASHCRFYRRAANKSTLAFGTRVNSRFHRWERVTERVLVACMGNLLRGDDGFGVAVARALDERDLPAWATVTEVGISGVSMAQDLLDEYDALVLVDAMERGEVPGTLYVERAEVPDLDDYSKREIAGFAADMHQTDPSKVLVLGEALGVLPDLTLFVGCEPQDTDDLADRLSDPVRETIPRAVEQIELILDELEPVRSNAERGGNDEDDRAE